MSKIIGADQPSIVDATGKPTQTEARAVDRQMLQMKNDTIEALKSIVEISNEYLEKLEKTEDLETVVGIKVMFGEAVGRAMQGEPR